MNAILSYDEYMSECKRLFNADRYGWSFWEREIALDGWGNDDTPQEAASRMNDAWARRRANRNV